MSGRQKSKKKIGIDLITKVSQLLKGEILDSDKLLDYKWHDRVKKSYKRLAFNIQEEMNNERLIWLK